MRLHAITFFNVLTFLSCGDLSEKTAGKRIVLHTEIRSSTSFTTEVGWSVTLRTVTVAIGSLYYFDGAPVVARRPRSLLREWFSIREAWAHPGHYQVGNAVGQMLSATATQTTAMPLSLADGEGVTGTYRSARWVFGAPPTGPAASALGSAVVVLEGSAAKGAETRTFKLVAEPSDTTNAAGKAEVEGCVFEEVDVTAEGTVSVALKPNIWVNQIDFSELPTGSTTSPVDRSTRAFREFSRGLKNGAAIVFAFTKSPTRK